MRLADYIFANIEPILVDWEAFARSIWPVELTDPDHDPTTLRDDAEALLRATASDMKSHQTDIQQTAKSKGDVHSSATGERINKASVLHGAARVESGFELWAVVAEYRALRASVLRLWRNSHALPDDNDLDDITRFNESIDQSLTEAVRAYTVQVERNSNAALVREQSARADAENANRAKDLFLANLSHELRTPLGAIAGWVGILRHNRGSQEELAEGLDVIDRSTKAQVKLIEDMLDVSRIISGKPSSLLDTRVVYCGDNLEQLANLPDACVDLIYIDPALLTGTEMPSNSMLNQFSHSFTIGDRND